MDGVRIGTSGWNYRDWPGAFYPEDVPQPGWLSFYATRFDTVEVNATFYRLPSRETVRAWRDAVGDGFVFAVKGSRFITHMKKLKDPREHLARFFTPVEALGDKLGPILWQLPPNWGYDGDRLEAFLEALPRDHRYAVELRHPSWYNAQCFDLLAAHDVALCVHDAGNRVRSQGLTTDLTYVRFHGSRSDAHGGYNADELAWWSRRIADWRREGAEVYAYFNNDRAARAPRDAARLLGLLAARAPAGRR